MTFLSIIRKRCGSWRTGQRAAITVTADKQSERATRSAGAETPGRENLHKGPFVNLSKMCTEGDLRGSRCPQIVNNYI